MVGPMPSWSCRSRNHARASEALSTSLNAASRSFTWAASTNRKPPYLTYGIRRRPRPNSSRFEWCAARTNTACSLRAMPSSRCASICSQTAEACASSSAHLTSLGRIPARAFAACSTAENPSGSFGSDGICHVENLLVRSVIGAENYSSRARKRLFEIQDVTGFRSAERVDRLCIIADDGDSFIGLGVAPSEYPLAVRSRLGTRQPKYDRTNSRAGGPTDHQGRRPSRAREGRRNQACLPPVCW